MAAPIVAGTAALLRQYFKEGESLVVAVVLLTSSVCLLLGSILRHSHCFSRLYLSMYLSGFYAKQLKLRGECHAPYDCRSFEPSAPLLKALFVNSAGSKQTNPIPTQLCSAL